MNSTLKAEQEILANYMSQISERCYSAGWMLNLEYILWDAITNGPRKFGHDFITEKDIKTLRTLSLKISGWITFDNTLEETYIENKQWEVKFSEAINDNPSILKG